MIASYPGTRNRNNHRFHATRSLPNCRQCRRALSCLLAHRRRVRTAALLEGWALASTRPDCRSSKRPVASTSSQNLDMFFKLIMNT